MIAGGVTGAFAGPELASFFSAAGRLGISQYIASGRSARKEAVFAGSPAMNTIGICRVLSVFRSQTATSRPWLGRRDRSITITSGGLVRMARQMAPPSPWRYSISNPALRQAARSGPASASFQWMTRATGMGSRGYFKLVLGNEAVYRGI